MPPKVSSKKKGSAAKKKQRDEDEEELLALVEAMERSTSLEDKSLREATAAYLATAAGEILMEKFKREGRDVRAKAQRTRFCEALAEERSPEDWEPETCERVGAELLNFVRRELSLDEKRGVKDEQSPRAAAASGDEDELARQKVQELLQEAGSEKHAKATHQAARAMLRALNAFTQKTNHKLWMPTRPAALTLIWVTGPNFQSQAVHEVDQRCVKAAMKIVDWVKSQREADEYHAAAYGGTIHPLGGCASLFGERLADRTWRSRFFGPLWVAQTLLTQRIQLDAAKCTQSAVTVGTLLEWAAQDVSLLLSLRKEDVAGTWHVGITYRQLSEECATFFAASEKPEATQEKVETLEKAAKEEEAKQLQKQVQELTAELKKQKEKEEKASAASSSYRTFRLRPQQQRLTEREPNREARPRCYNCGLEGHKAKECRLPRQPGFASRPPPHASHIPTPPPPLPPPAYPTPFSAGYAAYPPYPYYRA